MKRPVIIFQVKRAKPILQAPVIVGLNVATKGDRKMVLAEPYSSEREPN